MDQYPASAFKDICDLVGYKRKKVYLKPTNQVTLIGLNWDSGSKSQYSAVDLRTKRVMTPELGRPHPMDNKMEGARIEMRPDVLICEHGIFLGKPSIMTIYVHPANLPQLLEGTRA